MRKTPFSWYHGKPGSCLYNPHATWTCSDLTCQENERFAKCRRSCLGPNVYELTGPFPPFFFLKKTLHVQERPKRHGGTPLYLRFHRQNEVGQKRPYYLHRKIQVVPPRIGRHLSRRVAYWNAHVDVPHGPAAAVPLTATFRFGAHVDGCRPGFRPPEMMRINTMRLCHVMIKAHLR